MEEGERGQSRRGPRVVQACLRGTFVSLMFSVVYSHVLFFTATTENGYYTINIVTSERGFRFPTNMHDKELLPAEVCVPSNRAQRRPGRASNVLLTAK
ncbi:hypothetical protein FKM82_023255 [Ascaphus truei]